MIIVDLLTMKQITKKRDSDNPSVYYLDPIQDKYNNKYVDDPNVIAIFNNKRYHIKMSDYYDGNIENANVFDIDKDEFIEQFTGDYVFINKGEQAVNFYVRNIKTGGVTILAKNDYIAWSSRIYGDYLVWTVNRGRKDSQYTNVCYAKIK